MESLPRQSLWPILIVVVFMAIIVLMRLSVIPKHPTPTLQDAIASGTITAVFSGTGGSSGDSVKLLVSKGANAGTGTLEAILPAGSVLASEDPNAQSMMVAKMRGVDLGGNAFRPESQIGLNDSGAVTYLIAAYCIQFERENPSSKTRFTLQRPDQMLTCIAQRGSSLTIPALQAAVWMRTDNMTYAHMKDKFQVTAEEWAAGQNVFQECKNAPETNPNTAQ